MCRSVRRTEQARKRTAYHEAGHAIVALHTPGASPIHKATIVPRGHALGMVSQVRAVCVCTCMSYALGMVPPWSLQRREGRSERKRVCGCGCRHRGRQQKLSTSCTLNYFFLCTALTSIARPAYRVLWVRMSPAFRQGHRCRHAPDLGSSLVNDSRVYCSALGSRVRTPLGQGSGHPWVKGQDTLFGFRRAWRLKLMQECPHHPARACNQYVCAPLSTHACACSTCPHSAHALLAPAFPPPGWPRR